jgi:hypothetical protein
VTVLAAFILAAPIFLLLAGERIADRIAAHNQARREGQ